MFILDTNVVSETMQPAPSLLVMNWFARQPKKQFFVTTITVAEIFYGVELLPIGKRRDKLLTEAEAMFDEDFAARLLPFDEAAARIFPQIAVARRKQGRPISEFDAQIAAIARSRNAILATRNTADFEGCGLRLVNPWHQEKSS
ncbi:MAG TPA: type II toxin-antitoxin system VapC family toxin [Candidatus Sulfotelmatobacter sp.]